MAELRRMRNLNVALMSPSRYSLIVNTLAYQGIYILAGRLLLYAPPHRAHRPTVPMRNWHRANGAYFTNAHLPTMLVPQPPSRTHDLALAARFHRSQQTTFISHNMSECHPAAHCVFSLRDGASHRLLLMIQRLSVDVFEVGEVSGLRRKHHWGKAFSSGSASGAQNPK
jgi:hypothetical protein